MKAFFYLAAFVFVLGLVSCSEEEEPISPLIGTWENRVYVDSLDYWFVESYSFKNDSVFDIEITVRQTESGPDLGYRMISTSWYNLDNNTFKYYYAYALTHFSVDSEALPVYYAPKEELSATIVDFFGIPEGELTFSPDKKKFEFQENCLKLDPSMECIQFPSKEYIRVD